MAVDSTTRSLVSIADDAAAEGDDGQPHDEVGDAIVVAPVGRATAAAAAPALTRSGRGREVEGRDSVVILLAMAGMEISDRRRLADAVAAAVRIRPPVTGQQIVDSGIESGPWGGQALPLTYRFRPNGDDPETSIMEIMFLFAKGPDGSHPDLRPPSG